MDKLATLNFLNNCIKTVYEENQDWKEFNINLKNDIRKWAEASNMDDFDEPVPAPVIDITRLRAMRDLKNNSKKIILISSLKDIAKSVSI